MYAAAHGGKLPDDLGALLLEGDVTGLDPRDFICPESDHTPASGTTPAELAAELLKPGHCSYIYFGGGRVIPRQEADSTGVIAVARERPDILAVELPENRQHKGINVLFATGHTEWLNGPDAEALLLKLGFERIETSAAERR
jgi:hypothetical protein